MIPQTRMKRSQVHAGVICKGYRTAKVCVIQGELGRTTSLAATNTSKTTSRPSLVYIPTQKERTLRFITKLQKRTKKFRVDFLTHVTATQERNVFEEHHIPQALQTTVHPVHLPATSGRSRKKPFAERPSIRGPPI